MDHVRLMDNDPDWIPPMRPIWWCNNSLCSMAMGSNEHKFWDETGDWYGNGSNMEARGSFVWKMRRKHTRERWLSKNHLNWVNRLKSWLIVSY